MGMLVELNDVPTFPLNWGGLVRNDLRSGHRLYLRRLLSPLAVYEACAPAQLGSSLTLNAIFDASPLVLNSSILFFLQWQSAGLLDWKADFFWPSRVTAVRDLWSIGSLHL